MSGEKDELYDAIFGSYKKFQRMVRTERYKLIRYPQIDKVQLFDLEKDPLEQNNLAGDPAFSDLVKKLDARLRSLQQEVGDEFRLDEITG